MRDHPTISKDTPTWMFFVWASFVISVGLTIIGIYWLPTDLWIKGYLAMGLFFSLGSSITLTKTIRDNHEAEKLINRVAEAQTEKILVEQLDLRKA